VIIAILAALANLPLTIASAYGHRWFYNGADPPVRHDLVTNGAVMGHLTRGFGETVAVVGERQVSEMAARVSKGLRPAVGSMQAPPWAARPRLPNFQVAGTYLYGWPWRWIRCVDQFNFNTVPVSSRRGFGLLPIGLVANTALFAACLWLGIVVFHSTLARVRVRRGCCRGCGYDLRGITKCPECGL
jgi:hypothetical protein